MQVLHYLMPLSSLSNYLEGEYNNMKTLSISVAAYNAEKFLSRCLNSFIIPEIINELEILIIDDGSTDSTRDIAEQYATKYPGVFRVVHKNNGGHGSTINTSTSIATGKYFKIVDADDWIKKDGLLELIKQLKASNADLVLNPYVTVVEDTKCEEIVYPFRVNKSIVNCEDIPIDVISDILSLSMHTITFKTELIRKSEYRITEKCFYVDSEYTSYYFRDVETVRYIPVVLYAYRIGAEEQSVSFKSMLKRKDEHLIVCKHIYEYYVKEGPVLNKANSDVIYRRLIDILNAEYKILLHISEKKIAYEEMKNMIDYFDKRSQKLLKNTMDDGCDLNYLYTRATRFLYRNHFRCFGIIHLLCKMKKY